MTVATRTVEIASPSGLHARPAKLLAQAAAATAAEVTIAKGDGAPVDASSILAVMALGAAQGDRVTLRAEGDGAEAAVEQLAALLGTDDG